MFGPLDLDSTTFPAKARLDRAAITALTAITAITAGAPLRPPKIRGSIEAGSRPPRPSPPSPPTRRTNLTSTRWRPFRSRWRQRRQFRSMRRGRLCQPVPLSSVTAGSSRASEGGMPLWRPMRWRRWGTGCVPVTRNCSPGGPGGGRASVWEARAPCPIRPNWAQG